jgi:hypothetical protein
MKNFFILVLMCLPLAACHNGGLKSPSNADKTFNQYFNELESETQENPDAAQDSEQYLKTAFETETDRFAQMQISAQKERRASAPIRESDFIFKIMPEKGAYIFDERNMPVSDAPKDSAYKTTKRLWNKPKRIAPSDATFEDAPTQAGNSGGDDFYYDE